jgi:hypothetical protein
MAEYSSACNLCGQECLSPEPHTPCFPVTKLIAKVRGERLAWRLLILATHSMPL